MKVNIFNNKYIPVLCPFSIENLFDLNSFVKMIEKDINFNERKKIVINIIEFLLDNKIFYVLDKDYIFNKHESVKINLSNQEILDMIDEKWVEQIEWEDFYFLAWFQFENWYRDGLIKLGLIPTTDWDVFVENKIGDLEKWIDDHKPKD